MIAASDSVKHEIARPPYIGLPCSRRPGVPSLTSKSTISLSSSAQWAGMRPPSKTIVCEPLPFRPSRWPQSSSIVHSLFGATNSSIRGIPRSSSPGSTAWPM